MINRNTKNRNSESKSFLDQTASKNTSKAFIQQSSSTSPPTRRLACNASNSPDEFVNIAKKERSLTLLALLSRCSTPLLMSMLVNLCFYVYLFILPLVSRINNNAGMLSIDNAVMLSIDNRQPENDTGILSANDRKPNSVVFGHLHMMKTAGTEINGLLASRFKSVCGHKGYSYDAYQFNKRLEINVGNHTPKENTGDLVNKHIKKHNRGRVPQKIIPGHHTPQENTGDLVNKQWKNFNRGRVPLDIMREIGFEDCDYISLETGWKEWSNVLKAVGARIELHIPCREPINHLMSMCNMFKKTFNCAGNIELEIRKCMILFDRFNDALTRNVKLDLKCFNPIPIDPYIQYMGDRLQRKRKENRYIHRDTNQIRNKDKECIWKMPDIKRKVRDILVNSYEFFHFCDICMGTEKELLLRNATR